MSEIQVWYLLGPRWERSDYATLVSDDERLRASRFHFENDAGRFLASRALVRAAVGRQLAVPPGDLEFDRRCTNCSSSDHGRPTVRLPDGSIPPVNYSLTRAGPVVAVAIGSGPLGLDAEPLRDGIEELGDGSFFSAGERRWMHDGPSSEVPVRVLRLWVAKEAVGKASGLGLEQADQVLVSLLGEGWRRATDAKGHSCWMTELDIPGAAAAALATYRAPSIFRADDASTLVAFAR